jgi:hypothetical protein
MTIREFDRSGKTKENMGELHSTQMRQMDANTLIGYVLKALHRRLF